MRVIRDLSGGPKPSPMDVFYNGIYNADCTTLRYKGSLAKITDHDNAEGHFVTWAGTTTLYESLFGILEEEVGTADNYLPTNGTYAMVTKKVSPVLPSTVIRGEYARTDPAAGTIADTGGTASAAGTALTITMTASAAMSAGGWVYFLDGSNANYLHYVQDNSTTGMTFSTACVGAVASGNTFLHVQPANTTAFKLDDHEVNIESEVVWGNRSFMCVGLMHFISDVGIPLQKLDRAKHDGLKLVNPRFYHDFVVGGSATVGSVWRDTLVKA